MYTQVIVSAIRVSTERINVTLSRAQFDALCERYGVELVVGEDPADTFSWTSVDQDTAFANGLFEAWDANALTGIAHRTMDEVEYELEGSEVDSDFEPDEDEDEDEDSEEETIVSEHDT